MIDFVYRKDENYHPKVFFLISLILKILMILIKTFTQRKFEWRKLNVHLKNKRIAKNRETRIFYFSGSESSLLKYKKKIKLGAREFHFLKYRNFSRAFFFFFFFIIFEAWKVLSWNFLFLGLESSISHNMRKAFSKKFHFLKYKKQEESFSGWFF